MGATTICESNGIDDNEWTLPKGITATCEFPIRSFTSAIKELCKANTAAEKYFEPEEAARKEKWIKACAIANGLSERYGLTGSMEKSALVREIADAINMFNL